MNEPKLNNVFEERLTFLISEEEIITCEIEKLEKELDILENKREVFRIQLEELMRIKHKTEKVSQDCAPVIKARPFLAECVPYLVYHPEFESLRDVHRALDNLESIARETGVLTVAGYYRACNEPVTNVADNEEWGWIGTTIHMGVPVVEYTGTNYRIDMPDPMKLEDMELFKHKDIPECPDENKDIYHSIFEFIGFTKYVMRSYDAAVKILNEVMADVTTYGTFALDNYYDLFGEIPELTDFQYGWTAEDLNYLKIEMLTSNDLWIFKDGEAIAEENSKDGYANTSVIHHALRTVWKIKFPDCRRLVW